MRRISEFFRNDMIEKSLTFFFQAVCIFFFLLTYYSLGSTYENIEIPDEFPYFRADSILENIVFLLLLLLFIWVAMKTASNIFHKSLSRLTMDAFAAIVSVIAAIFGIYWMVASGTAPQADQLAVCDYASAFNEGDFSSLQIGGYVFVYPHQLGIITFLRLLFSIVGNGNFAAFQCLSAVMAGCIVFLGYKITKILSDDNHKIIYLSVACLNLCAALFLRPVRLWRDHFHSFHCPLCMDAIGKPQHEKISLLRLAFAGNIWGFFCAIAQKRSHLYNWFFCCHYHKTNCAAK